MSKISLLHSQEKELLVRNLVSQFGDQGKVNILETSELGDSLKQLNDDETDPQTQMSGIDLRTRLGFSEISSILAVDTLVAFKFITPRCLILTKQKKRLVVSLGGKGRKEIVDIVAGKRDQDQKKGIFGGLFNKKETV
jgi:hypothetical protein